MLNITKDVNKWLSIEDFSKRLKDFLKDNLLNISDLRRICDSQKLFSRSSCHRIINGQINQEYYLNILPVLEIKLEDWMFSQNWTETKTNEILDSLFPYREDANMIIQRTILTAAAVKFFGLQDDPFDVDRVPGDDEFFSNKELDEISQRITDAVIYKRFLCVTGPIGTGKTSMKIRVARKLKESSHKVHLIYPEFFDMSDVKVGAIATAILEEFEVKVPRNPVSRVKAIKQQLAARENDGERIALIFDECHRLNESVIISLKNFWEMTNNAYSRLLSVVLFGQPKFVDTTLRDIKFREIAERVDVLEMPPISKSASDYLRHKIAAVGGDMDQLFEPKAVQRICSVARTPLALGNLANYALMEAYKKEETKVVSGMLTLPDAPALRGIRRAA